MEIKWMGRYRELIRTLVFHVNKCNQIMQNATDIADGVVLTTAEWQVWECILEQEDEHYNMLTLSNILGIPQSTFSKITKKLCEMGLVKRYQEVGNRKNIILQGTPQGRKMYKEHTENVLRPVFRPLFDRLEEMSDGDLERMVQALMTFHQPRQTEEKEIIPLVQGEE